MLKHNQSGSLLLYIPLALALLLIVVVGTFTLTRGNGTAKLSFTAPAPNLPSIDYFQNHKSDQFLVDMDVVASGTPYLGENSLHPHMGAHINFSGDYKTWPRGGSAPDNYPAIYAVADGIATQVHPSTPAASHDKYDISIELAKDVDFDYSIEPFIKEPSPGFYKNFIKVHDGQQVKKGQIIGYMYFPNYDPNGTHIHFDLHNVKSGQFMAPAIFTQAVVQAFHDRWGSFGFEDPQNQRSAIPACMGYKLAAAENPFGTGATTCLN